MFRKIFIRVTFFVIIFAFLIWQGWSFFNFSSGLKKILQAKLEESLGPGSSIENVRFGLGTVQLSDVNLVFPESPYEVAVKELRLGYSLVSLVKGRGKLEKTAEEITFYKPKLTLTYNAQKESKPDVNLSFDLTREQEEQYRSFIKEYDFIKKITISEGEIVARESNSKTETQLARQISGWAYTDDNARAWLRVAGHLFDSKEYNMVIYGQFNLQRGRLDFVNVDLHNYKLGDDVPFLLPNYFEVLDGAVNGHLNITERRQPTRGFNIEGAITLSNGQLKLVNDNLYFENIQLEAQIKDWNLYIKHASQTINGSPTRVEGVIKNLLAPELELRLSSQEFDIEKFLRTYLPNKRIPVKGSGQIELDFSESFASPQIAGVIKADSLWVSGFKFSGLETKAELKNLALKFEDIAASLRNADISGAGSIDFLSPDKLVDFKLVLTGDFTDELQYLGAPPTDHCVGQSQIQVLGPLATPVSRGQFKLFFTEESSQSLAINGSFIYSDRKLTLNTASSDNELRMNLSAENLFKTPRYSIEVTNLEKLFVLFNNPELNFIRQNYYLNLLAEGTRSKPYAIIKGFRRENHEPLFEIKTDTAAYRAPNSLVGDIALFPDSPASIPGDFEIDFTASGVRVRRIYLGDRVNGSVEISQSSGGANNTVVQLTGFKFAGLNALSGNVLPPFEGELFGRVDIERRERKTRYFGDLWLFNGFIKGVGPYKGELSFAANSTEIICRKLALEKNVGASLLAQGEYNFSSKELNATIAGHSVNVGEVIHLITGKTDLVDGSALIQVTLKGRGPKILLYGSVDITKARILMFEFDESKFDFGSERAPNGSYISKDALYIGHALLNKSHQFTLTGPVLLPLTGKASLDVQMSGDGNFLAMLSDIDPFFKKSSSAGHLDLRMTGQYTRPNFSTSRFTFQNGILELTSVANKVENIAGDLRVRADDYFLDIVKLQGSIRNQPFWISNTNALSGLNHGVYEPLRVGGDDLSFGAIQLRTGPNGIPLHIPGLMESGDVGWYELVGKDSLDQLFFIAGPWVHPVVRGRVNIRSANLMFPFDESSGNGEYTLVKKILDNLNWDVQAIAIKDTRYVKQFAAGVYVNMEVDPKNSGLNFSGILGDSTFRITGKVESTRGEFEYIDLTFRVEKFGAEFDRTSLYPVVFGKAWTVVRDTANVPSDVYLELYTVDDITNREVTKGRWDRVNIKLSSEHPEYAQTEKEIMATLGYSSNTVVEQATRAVGYSTDKFIFRPIMRPIERQLERRLGLDVVRFSYAFTRNFLDANLNNEELSASLALLRSSRLTLGKYLTNDIYVIYTGELKAGIDYRYQNHGVGLQHVVGLEYRLNQNWLLQMEYDYNTLLQNQKDDKKIWLRHSFPF